MQRVKHPFVILARASLSLVVGAAWAKFEPVYKSDIDAWRAKVEKSLRSDNGWLTLAGRYELDQGANTVGTAADNRIVLAPGLSPPHLGAIEEEQHSIRNDEHSQDTPFHDPVEVTSPVLLLEAFLNSPWRLFLGCGWRRRRGTSLRFRVCRAAATAQQGADHKGSDHRPRPI